MVSDDNATREIFEEANGLLAANNIVGRIFVNSSTVSPAISKEMAEKCLRKDAYYLDAPVSGSVKQAVEASLVFMVGGDEKVFRQIKTLLEKLGKTILYVGNTGAGNTLKLAVNTQLAIYAQGLAEAALLAQKNNISMEHLLTVLNNSSMANVFMKLKGDMILNNNYQPAFALKHIVKDLGLAKNIGLDSPLGNAAFETYQKANKNFPEEDMIAVIKEL
jgi:3-hydroxyisobutyrate dehydrogenase